jgi:PAS domain S-box-containing protein
MNLPTFTVLIVEDLPENRELYRECLMSDSSCAYDLIEAGSVMEGLELWSTKTIDAILLDYLLPDGDGLKFLEILSERSHDRRPPVVMMTGHGNESIAVRAMKLGAQDYLVKGSFTPQLLISAMHSAIENARLRLQLQYSQEQLQASNEQITTIWESMTDAYISLDRDWRIVYTNPAAIQVIERLVGLAPEEFIGKTHWEVFPQSVDNFVEQKYRQAVTDRVAVHFEVFYEPIGTWFELHAYPSTAGLGIYFRDINERKWLEGERIAAERERKYNQAALEHRHQELDSFVWGVSHDLKAPLRAIANLAEWIEEDLAGALTVATQQQMTLLRSRVERMSATIDGLLDYARTGQTDGASESVVVAQLLAEVIDSLAPPPTFCIDIDPMPTVFTNRLRLFQVFANTIGNGIKHHDRSDGSIHISVRERGDFYEFAIADDGSGIAPEHHERVFMMFQAVNPQNRADSTGIGLAIVKKIIQAEGGDIRLESEVGVGATFYFTWPIGSPT